MARKPRSPATVSAQAESPLTIEYHETSTLLPFAQNARTHSESQVAEIAAAIQQFGFNNPVLIEPNGTIVAGHGRVMAAQKIGMSAVPVIRLGHLSEAQARAYRIADNKIALNSGWNMDLLRAELLEIGNLGMSIDALGFSGAEIRRMLGSRNAGLTDPDEIPEPQDAVVSTAGDIWLLGDHRLICGDACDRKVMSGLMGEELADILFTDPPWNVNYGAVKAGNPKGYRVRKIMNDHMTPDRWRDFVEGFCSAFRNATKPGAPVYVVMSAQEWPVVDAGLRNAGFHWSSTIIWVKDQLVLSRKDYHTQYEPLWYGWNDSASRLQKIRDRKQSDVWNIARPKASELHPTTKPVELVQRALDNSSQDGDIVLDCFGGSGSTLIAAEQTARRSRLVELDPRYCDVIVRRWQAFTGRTARRLGTDESFDETAAARSEPAAAAS